MKLKLIFPYYGLQSLENVEDKNDDPLPFSSHEYETMNPLIRDDGKNPSASASEKLNHKPSNADGALGTYTTKTTTVKPFNLNPNVNGDNSPTHFMSTFQGIKKAF